MEKTTYTFYFTCCNCGTEHKEEIPMGKDANPREECPYCGNYTPTRFSGNRTQTKQSTS